MLNKFMKGSYFEFLENVNFSGYAYAGLDAYWSAQGKTILWTYSRNYESQYFIPNGNCDEDIIIEDNEWIGLGVTILPRVFIAAGTIVGMNTVVTKDVPSCEVGACYPAKFRNVEKYRKLKEENILYLEHKYENT